MEATAKNPTSTRGVIMRSKAQKASSNQLFSPSASSQKTNAVRSSAFLERSASSRAGNTAGSAFLGRFTAAMISGREREAPWPGGKFYPAPAGAPPFMKNNIALPSKDNRAFWYTQTELTVVNPHTPGGVSGLQLQKEPFFAHPPGGVKRLRLANARKL